MVKQQNKKIELGELKEKFLSRKSLQIFILGILVIFIVFYINFFTNLFDNTLKTAIPAALAIGAVLFHEGYFQCSVFEKGIRFGTLFSSENIYFSTIYGIEKHTGRISRNAVKIWLYKKLPVIISFDSKEQQDSFIELVMQKVKIVEPE
jgi:hypothetical protein